MPSSKTTNSIVAGGVLAAAAVGGMLALNQPKCTDGNVVCLNWAASVGWNDNTPFANDAAVNYNVYRVAATYPNPSTSTKVAQTTNLNVMLTSEPRGNQCWVVTANAKLPAPETQRAESAAAGPVCKFVRPAAPTDGAIEAPTDGAIEPK